MATMATKFNSIIELLKDDDEKCYEDKTYKQYLLRAVTMKDIPTNQLDFVQCLSCTSWTLNDFSSSLLLSLLKDLYKYNKYFYKYIKTMLKSRVHVLEVVCMLLIT